MIVSFTWHDPLVIFVEQTLSCSFINSFHHWLAALLHTFAYWVHLKKKVTNYLDIHNNKIICQFIVMPLKSNLSNILKKCCSTSWIIYISLIPDAVHVGGLTLPKDELYGKSQTFNLSPVGCCTLDRDTLVQESEGRVGRALWHMTGGVGRATTLFPIHGGLNAHFVLCVTQ